jgi:hypothetical protein
VRVERVANFSPEDLKSKDLRLKKIYAVAEMCDECGFLAVAPRDCDEEH